MTLHLETKRKISEAIEPAKKWRNRWLALERHINTVNGETVTPGAFWGPLVFPSKDIAETSAMSCVADSERLGIQVRKYVGAFPIEGEAP